MLSNGVQSFAYDSANRLINADGHTYTYNAEDVRIRNLCSDADTTYTYNTNCRLSQLLQKTTNGVVTKYVYGIGLIGEEKCGEFKTYHFDCRGSTVAITDECGNITDTFKYDTYGKMTEHIGNSFVILGYNGRDGVVTDKNGLIYMRARYYSPEMKRFINADVIAGAISNAITLNRYAYANGNPVSFIDPFGLSAWSWLKDKYNKVKKKVVETYNDVKDYVVDTYNDAKKAVSNAYRETKEWATDTYQEVKERVVNTYNDVKENIIEPVSSFVEEKIIEPVVEKVEAIAEQLNINDFNDVLRTVADIGVTGIALTSGVINGYIEYMRKGGLIRPVSALASGIGKGVATFGAVNNLANGLYYNLTPDDVKSDITSSSYSNNGTKYINRWDRLDYTKQQTGESHYNLNAWRYNSEYSVHMYGWYATGWANNKNIPVISGLSAKFKDANIETNAWDSRWYVNAATIVFGILGQ